MDEKPTSLAAALALLQTRLPKIDKGKTATVKGETAQGKPFSYSYDYADLADVTAHLMPLLGEVGLSFVSMPTLNADGKFVLRYSLIHDSDSEPLTGEYPLPIDIKSPQAMGGAITYARRYCLTAITGAVADADDDASSAQTETGGGRGGRRGGQHSRRTDASPERVERDHAAALAGPGPDDEDDWPEAARPGSRPASQDENRRRAMMAEFSKAGLADDAHRDERLRGIAAVVGRPVASSSELTPAEVEQVITALKRRRQGGSG
jgi:hypothetical protein